MCERSTYVYLYLLGFLDTRLRILPANTTILFTDGWSIYLLMVGLYLVYYKPRYSITLALPE